MLFCSLLCCPYVTELLETDSKAKRTKIKTAWLPSNDHLVIVDILLHWWSIHLFIIYYDVNKFFSKVFEAMSSWAWNRNSFYKEECTSHYRKFFLSSLITFKIYFWPCWVFTVLLAFLSFRRAGAIHSVHKIYKSGWCLVGDWHSESPCFGQSRSLSVFFSFRCAEPFSVQRRELHMGFL